jgi:hypothetical protein
MANPLMVDCPVDIWTKVATNVTAGSVLISRNTGPTYIQTYRLTGEAAPINEDDAILIEQPGEKIESLLGIDVYVKAKNEDGEVRVDL